MSKQKDGWVAHHAGRSQWKPEDARRIVAAWEQSGESMSGFAARHGLRSARIAWWRERLVEDGPVFVPITVREGERDGASPAPVAIAVGAVRIEVNPVAVVPAWCAALVDALARRSP
jgi:transposase-like protein